MKRTGITRTAGAVVVLVIVGVSAFAAYEAYSSHSSPSCPSLPTGGVRGQTTSTTFGAVTEYRLPGQDRWPNAVTVAPDGSVWFAEQVTPGVAHLYPGNGTVVEYAWPGFAKANPPDCVPTVNLSGMAIWNGRVWAADEFDNRTIGLEPRHGGVVSIDSSSKAPFPYWLAVGPDGNLWFTSSSFAGQPARLGKILPDMTLEVVSLVGLGDYQPVKLEFVNSTLALLSTIDEATNSTTHSCQCTGRVYSFDPSEGGGSVAPKLVGGTYRLVLPTSVAFAAGSVWVTQHGGSKIVGYNLTSESWKTFPTSLISWSGATLPLEVEGSGTRVWFNEHIANKIALLDPSRGTLTEYSESDPPATTASGIQNDLSIAASPTGVWFTSMSGNYVGFVDGNADPGFHVSVVGSGRATTQPGGNVTFQVRVSGTWPRPIGVNVSDSERLDSVPTSIRIVPGSFIIQPGVTSYDLLVRVDAGRTTSPGDYTIAVTVTDGLVQQTAYIFLVVS